VFENSDYVRFVRLMSSGSRARKSDDPAMLPAIKHADRAALADSTWMRKVYHACRFAQHPRNKKKLRSTFELARLPLA